MKKIKDIVTEIILISIVFLSILLFGFMSSVAFANDVPTEVPPCPDEYEGGLIP